MTAGRARALRLASAALVAGSLGCRGAGRVVRLPVPQPEWVSIAYETRPGCWLSEGDRIEWDLPPGPARRLEGGYGSALAGFPDASLEITLRRTGPRASTLRRVVLPITPDPLKWGHWSASLPGTSGASVLEVAFRADSKAPLARSLFLGEPVFSIPQRQKPRTIVLFLVDTLRADRVSGYGYSRPTTPRIDRFFREGLRAARCLPAANWTLPSHASLFTSTSVARHGVGRYGQFLPEALATVAEAVGSAGYRTLAVTGGGYVDPAFGLARGFDQYAVLAHPADDTVDRALAMLAEHPEEPVFLFVHTYQVHDYAPDEEDARELFPDLSVLGPKWKASVGAMTRAPRTDPRFAAWIRNRYDAALRSVDGAFGRLLEGLGKDGRLADTAVVFTSDHGEQLCDRSVNGDCLAWSHGSPYLYEEELLVPLEIRVPWRPGARGEIRETTTLLDVAPTLAEMAEAPVPASFEGRPLLSGAAPAGRLIATEAPPLDAFTVREGSLKLIRRNGTPQNSWIDGSPFSALVPEECFDLAKDPGETHRVPCSPEAKVRLRERADRYLASSFTGSVVVRVPPGFASNGEVVVRARGRREGPLLRTFGLASRKAVETPGSGGEVRFSDGPAPVWLAFQPADGARALELDVGGLSSLVSARGEEVSGGVRQWDRLAWSADGPLPEGASVFTTPESIGPAPVSRALPTDVVARLLALGYLRGSPVAPPHPASASGAASADLPPGEVRIRRAD